MNTVQHEIAEFIELTDFTEPTDSRIFRKEDRRLLQDADVLTEEEKNEYLNAVVTGFCPECGNAVYQNPRGRKKKFCCEACRFAWKNKHPKPQNWKSSRTASCPVCGKEFIASREYQRKRKYCSRACANKGRALAKKGLLGIMADGPEEEENEGH